MGNCSSDEYCERMIYDEEDLKEEDILQGYKLKRGNRLIYGRSPNRRGLTVQNHHSVFDLEPELKEDHYIKLVKITGLGVYLDTKRIYIKLDRPLVRYSDYRDDNKDIRECKIEYRYTDKIDNSILKLLKYFSETEKRIKASIEFKYSSNKDKVWKSYISHTLLR